MKTDAVRGARVRDKENRSERAEGRREGKERSRIAGERAGRPTKKNSEQNAVDLTSSE